MSRHASSDLPPTVPGKPPRGRWSTLRLGAFVLLALLPGAPPGRAAGESVVRTSAGATMRGNVTLEAGGLAVKPATGDPVHVPLAELVEWVSAGAPAGGDGSTDGGAAPVGAPLAEAWTPVSIGPGSTGEVRVADGGLLVGGRGTGLRGTTDGFFFAQRALEASGQVVARLESFDGAAAEAMAGVSLRDNLGEAAAYAFLGIRAGAGLCFQYRQIAGGMTLRTTNVSLALPAWLRLGRMGGSVVADLSADGVQWQTIGRANVNVGQQARAGLVVASGSETNTATARFGNAQTGPRGMGYAATAGYPRLLMRGGSVLVAPVESADESVLRLGGGLAGTMVSGFNLARIEYLPLTPELAARLEAGRRGVLLTDGDFLDGTLRRIETNTVTMSSLLFGFRRFAAGTEAAAVQAGEVEPEPAGFRIILREGSDLRARQLEIGPEGIRAESPLLGSLLLPADAIVQLRRGDAPR